MRVKCETCAAGYTLPASKLKPGRRVQFACRRCGHRIVVAVPAAAAPQPAAARSRISASPQVTGSRAPGPASAIRRGASTGRPAPRPQAGTGGKRREPRRDPVGGRLAVRPGKGSTETQVKWFVANADGSHRKMLGHELKAAIEAGEVHGDALVWRKGWPEWRPAEQAAEWQPLLAHRKPAGEASATSLVQVAAEPAPDTDTDTDTDTDADTDEDEDEDEEEQKGVDFPDESTSLEHAAHADAELPDDALLDQEPDKSQRTVSLPIVRVPTGAKAVSGGRPKPLRSRRKTALPQETAAQREVTPSSSRFAAGRAGTGTPMDSAQDHDALDSAWAPATDTYIGPRDRFTRRLGSDAQRQELLAQVDRERSMLRQLRFWQWIALGCACAAIVAFGLTVYALINMRIAQSELKHLRAEGADRAAITSPLNTSP